MICKKYDNALYLNFHEIKKFGFEIIKYEAGVETNHAFTTGKK